MIIAGKCPPEKEELEHLEDSEFENIELYIEKKHLENFNRTRRLLKETSLNVVSVHTPHVHLEDIGYFWIADQLADEFDAFLVFHSKYLHHVHVPQLEELDIPTEYGYENNPGASRRHLEANILDKGHNMVLDTAHFYMSEENYVEEIDDMLDEWHDQIPLIHLCDSTVTDDGLGFGEGDMDMEAVSKTIEESRFDGILVFEVMPEFQEDGLQKWKEWIK